MASRETSRPDQTKGSENDNLRGAVLADLGRLERLVGQCDWPDKQAFAAARARARESALAMLEGGGTATEHRRAALLVAAEELLHALMAECEVSREYATRLAQRLEELMGVPRIVIARAMLRTPDLLLEAPRAALEQVLATLATFAPLRSVSLWKLDASERIASIGYAGEDAPSRRARQLAQQLLTGNGGGPDEPSERRQLIAVPVGRWEQPVAVLVGSARPWMGERCQVFLAEAAPVIAAVLERDKMLAANAAAERALVESSERKLTRLGFDLHDGPIQDVAVIAEDLRLFRDQLKQLSSSPSQQELVRGRIEDLDAQLRALDAGLRTLAKEVQAASVLLNKSFRAALLERVQAFKARTHIEPKLSLEGDLNSLSASQQIALLNIIQEALSNIREHANANAVEISVAAGPRGVKAKVRDDGRGFDLERTLLRAAREGRVGLIAMNERVRLLDGHYRIESRPGGPTTVSVSLERWLPVRETTKRASARRAGTRRAPASA